MVADRGWHAVSESCERRHRSAMTMLSERDWLEAAPAAAAPPSRHSRLASLTQRLREELREMARDVEEAARMATQPSLTAGERERRLGQVVWLYQYDSRLQ